MREKVSAGGLWMEQQTVMFSVASSYGVCSGTSVKCDTARVIKAAQSGRRAQEAAHEGGSWPGYTGCVINPGTHSKSVWQAKTWSDTMPTVHFVLFDKSSGTKLRQVAPTFSCCITA